MPRFHPAEVIAKVTKNPDYGDSFTWERWLCSIEWKEEELDGKTADELAVPLATFKEHVLGDYVEHIVSTPNILIYCQNLDYKKYIHPTVKGLWLAHIKKVVGYRALCRWVGATSEDQDRDFWVNLGSAEVKGIQAFDEDKEICIPPKFFEKRWNDATEREAWICKALQAVEKHVTIGEGFLDVKEEIATGCKLRIGQRLELLDYNVSSRVRPARIRAICGRRVHVQVLKVDCDTGDKDDRQYGPMSEFWVDQASFFLFPVGWAALNNYNLEAKSEYKRHSQRIADAILSGTEPPYAPTDVMPEQLAEWKQVPHANAKWEKGMKFELMDPLGSDIRDLSVATVLDVLQGGYLKIGMDGPDCEADCLPLHCTSPLLFPVGYSAMYDLVLNTPEEVKNFKWDAYLRQTKSKAAPVNFFKRNPNPERLEDFQIGAKLEASDMCENLLICPGTVVGIKGRLVIVNFDGWEESFNQYFDIDSKDIFPVGWCEIHGYKLERPKGYEPEELKKKKK